MVSKNEENFAGQVGMSIVVLQATMQTVEKKKRARIICAKTWSCRSER